jgi:hypothetical protein
MALVALILAALAYPFAAAIEWLKRPRLEAKLEGAWVGATPTDWTFAHVWIRNRPLPRGLRSILVRETASAATATLKFSKARQQVLPQIPARWSSKREPTKQEIGPTIEGSEWRELITTYLPEVVPQTLTNDLTPGKWEEVAVAVLFADGQAYAWGAESYSAGGRREDWKLERGEYEVAISVESSGISKTFEFRLDNFAADFSRFRLRSGDGTDRA